MVNYLALLIALALSFVAAYYSIVGLAVLFASAMIPVVIMASTLEAAKVVAASWLYRNWNDCPRWIKYYLTVAVIILMFITSMGIFGFLSKAHLDQAMVAGNTGVELKLIDQQLASENKRVENAQRSLDALDRVVDQVQDPLEANKIRNRQARERRSIENTIKQTNETIKQLNQQALPLRKDNLKIQAEVGPIKYIADLLYGESDDKVLEKAVRAVIIIIVIVFDPLAIALLLAANHSLGRNIPQPLPLAPQPEPIIVEDEPNDPPPSPKPKRVRVRQEKIAEVEQWEVEKKSEKPPRWENDSKPEWVDKVEELKVKKKKGIVEIDKAAIARMK